MGEKNTDEKIDEILKNQKKILKREDEILKREEKFEEEEVGNFEKIKKTLNKKNEPLTNTTKKDIIKGFIGSFIGVVGHFAFTKGFSISKELSIGQASLLYLVGFLILVLILYHTGFRRVEKHFIVKFLPIRASVLYITSIFTIIFVSFIFGTLPEPINFKTVYVLVGANIILAILGAGTADLIGRN